MSGIDYTTRNVALGSVNQNGGLNSTASGLAVRENESTDCQNVDFDKFGSVVKRSGYSLLNAVAFNSGAAWNSLYWLELSSGINYLVGTCGNKIAKMDALDGTWDDITGALTVTAGNNNFTSWATFLDTALGTNGVNPPFQWTGSGNASAMTVPTGLTKAKFVVIFHNYTFLCNVTVSGTDHKSRVYWSNIDSISSWNDSQFRDVNKNDGQTITGVKVLGDKIYIFKDRSIWYGSFTGDSDFPFIFDRTPSTVGCDSGFSIQEAENGLIFHSYDGFYFFDGANSFKLSDRITNTLNSFAKNRYQHMVSAYQRSKNRYIASFTLDGNTTHNRNITWDTFNNAFSYYRGVTANCFSIVNTNGEERIYFGDYAGYVYQADTGTNDNPEGVSTAISAYYYTKWFNFDDLCDQKGVPHVYIYYTISNSTLVFAYSYDFETGDQFTQTVRLSTSTALYGTAVYGVDTYAASGGAVVRRDLTGRGRTIRLKVSNSTLGETFRVDGFGILAYLETEV